MSPTLETLRVCYPNATSQNLSRFIEPLRETCERYEINTPQRLACFIAQAGHESAQLSATLENLNYSANALLRVFPKYFDAKDAVSFAKRPEAIANRVYANRMGNGPSESGDGWRYRGRGLFQNTGKDEYIRLMKALGIDLVNQPELLEGPLVAALAAGDFWNMKQFNSVADKADDWRREYRKNEEAELKYYDRFEWITFRINGGFNGLDDRLKLYTLAKQAFNVN